MSQLLGGEMTKQQLLEEIKKGIRVELDSVNLYEKSYLDSEDSEVKDFFKERIAEEKEHYNYLINYYNLVEIGKEMVDFTQGLTREESPDRDSIFSEEFLKRIGEKQTLFSAISTAVLLEKEALQFYKNLAQDVDDTELKSFFNRMGHWETEHYLDVLHIQKEAERHYWELNQFEPF